jgi:hypothetical protein
VEAALAWVMTIRVLRWLSRLRSPKVLHVFERSADLLDADGRVISIVSSGVGPGPFNLVLSRDLDLRTLITASARITVASGVLRVGDLAVELARADLWDPVPQWRSIAAELPGLAETIRAEMAVSPVKPGIEFDPPPGDDPAEAAAFALRLAGLGPGLTPSGDDVLMGWMHACYCRFPEHRARTLAEAVVGAAAPRTTSLSAAWLLAAADGEAGALWHRLVRGAANGVAGVQRDALRRILATGHTSGADALAGFVAGLV